ncbi:MAG: inositol monophosphatase [Verrucomicrobia bacterium]|nr:inositol monophosphatase [Verrucomicrobiota bacterium]
MKSLLVREALATAEEAAVEAGAVLRRNLYARKKVDAESAHDVKLALDVRCQRLIARRLAARFPQIPLLGEEEGADKQEGPYRWVVDPIDGTVNYSRGIPHACVAIALQRRAAGGEDAGAAYGGYQTLLGAVYEPFCEELWTAVRGGRARLNKRPVRVVPRPLEEAVVCLGFGKSVQALEYLAPALRELAERVRKIRIMGSAALALTYVASGRFDAYLEPGLQLWDIAAGGLIVQAAGGRFEARLRKDRAGYAVVAHNGALAGVLDPLIRRLRRFAG